MRTYYFSEGGLYYDEAIGAQLTTWNLPEEDDGSFDSDRWGQEALVDYLREQGRITEGSRCRLHNEIDDPKNWEAGW